MAESWLVSFLEELGAKLVAINTENPLGREAEAASFFAEKAAEHGLKARVFSHTSSRASALVELSWGEGPAVVFNSHLDTVPAGPFERWPFHPFQTGVRDGFLCGRGSVDAKGCLASMLAALVSLSRSERLSGRVVLMAVADEEVGGLGTLSTMNELERVDHVVVGEPTSMKICVASRGRVEINAEFHGRPAHAALPEEGVNAVAAAARAVLKVAGMERGFGSRHRYMGRMTAAATMFEGGLKPNVIPETAKITIDVRTTGQKPDEILKLFKRRLKPDRAYITAVIPDYSAPLNSHVVKASQRAVREAGLKPVLAGFRAATDLNRMAKVKRVEGVIVGPGSLSLAHSFVEKVALKELVKAAHVYKRIAELLLS
ncbi:MAG: M20/M25/M40 family metallo-hydrolase [Candidatus Caldarchaeum sp.]|nr:M20/M25/M40 family metallo-hydrolase [Candidatus Caldarchaeum sp.]